MQDPVIWGQVRIDLDTISVGELHDGAHLAQSIDIMRLQPIVRQAKLIPHQSQLGTQCSLQHLCACLNKLWLTPEFYDQLVSTVHGSFEKSGGAPARRSSLQCLIWLSSSAALTALTPGLALATLLVTLQSLLCSILLSVAQC